MLGILISVVKTDCQEISSSVLDNGLFEIEAPNKYTKDDIQSYLIQLGSEQLHEISAIQKEGTKLFRKKVTEMIDKYSKEFCISMYIKLSFPLHINKYNDIVDNKVDVSKSQPLGEILVLPAIQYFPDELIEKTVRFAVYKLARNYEEITKKLPKEKRYQIPINESESKTIVDDFSSASKLISEEIKKCNMMSY